MPKKSAIAIAVSIVGLLLASSIAMAMNIDMSSSDNADPDTTAAADTIEAGTTGSEEADAAPVAPEPEIITIMIDEPLPAVPASMGTASAGRAGVVLPANTVAPAEPAATPVPEVTYPIFDVGEAGKVALQFSAGSITFWGAYPNSGWDFTVEHDGPIKVEVEFRSGRMEIEFTAVLEGDQIRVDIKTEFQDDEDEDDRDEDHDEDHEDNSDQDDSRGDDEDNEDNSDQDDDSADDSADLNDESRRAEDNGDEDGEREGQRVGTERTDGEDRDDVGPQRGREDRDDAGDQDEETDGDVGKG